MTSTIETSATTSTCPWWCTEAAKHRRWDRLTDRRDDGTNEQRIHGRDFDDHVSFMQIEYRDDDGATVSGAPTVLVSDFEFERMTSAQARAHAANVFAAAELLDRVVAGR